MGCQIVNRSQKPVGAIPCQFESDLRYQEIRYEKAPDVGSGAFCCFRSVAHFVAQTLKSCISKA
jgi:hypothetical protein